MTDPRISVPAELADRYEILGPIGHGGMAIVYRAQDRRHGSQVAIKVLKQELVVALGGERFTREVRITAALQHPHILPLLDSGEAGGLPYYVMPFVEGASLAHRLEREGPLPIGEAVQYVAEVADALAYAHAKGLIHRDLKPANILLSQGHALLADFGVARVLDTVGSDVLTDSGMALGTAAYMSPEQAAGERVTSRADIYALGCVLYELLTGSPPFVASSQRAVMARHAVDPVPSIRTVRSEVPQALEAVIKRALAKTPADRYADAGEFRTAVLDAAAATDAPGAGAARRPRRAPWIALGVTAVAVAAFFVTRAKPVDALIAGRVMVYPLVLPADWKGSGTAGEDASTMIGSVMDGAGSLRWLDGWQLLSPARRNDMRSLADSEANALARLHHCQFVLTGRLAMRSGDSAEVLLSLRDLTKDSLVRKNGVSLARESWRAGLRAVTALLPTLIPAGAANVERDWADRDPQAVAHFLAGEAAFRRVRFADAVTEFKATVAADSTFGIAALRGAQAASWGHRQAEASSLVHVAIQHARSPRERAFAAGLEAYLDGNADSAVTALRAALAIDPEMAVAWTQLSETYLHLLPFTGRTDSLAGDALARAVALDSNGTQLLFHQVELAARAGAGARADSLAKRFLAVASDTMLRGEVELIAACANGRWTAASLHDDAVRRPQPLLVAAKSVGLAHPQCMHGGYTALLQVDTSSAVDAGGRRFFELMGLHHALLARGATDSAIAAIDRFNARWKYGLSLFLVDAPVIPALAARARQLAAADSAQFGADYRRAPYSTRLWLLGVWAAIDGHVPVAQSVAAELATRADTGRQRLDSVRAESVLAHVALARADTADAIRRFTSVLHRALPSDAVAWEESASLGLERLKLGQLLLARRRFAEARAVLEVLDSAAPASFPLYTRPALELRAQAAAALGDAAQAATLRQRASRLGS